MDNFLYIGVRDHFFTLRELIREVAYIRGEATLVTKHYHHQNLSQNAAEALCKAKEISTRIGFPLCVADGSKVLEESAQLEEIKRRSAEEIANTSRRAAEQLALRKEKEEAAQAAYNEQQMQVLRSGVFPDYFRKVRGMQIDDCDALSFVNWLIAERECFDAGSLIRQVADYISSNYSHLLLPKPMTKGHCGQQGKRAKFDVTVVRRMAFEGFYGLTYFVTMVTEEGHCLISKGSFAADVGQRLQITAFVKSHDEYKGQDQTVVNRVKIV